MKKQNGSIVAAIASGMVLSAASFSQAAVNYTTAGGTYSQNFNTLSSAGTTADLAWTNDSTLPDWSLFNSSGAAITTYRSDDGGSNVGNFFSYGTDSNSDRALGGLGSGAAYFGSPATGALAGHIAVQITNNTGSTLVTFTANYDGEQWRASNTTAQTMVVEYGFGATFASVATWTAAGAGFNFTSPQATTVNQLDGNLAANRTAGLGGTLSSLTWLNGTSLWLRFAEVNDSGLDHGLAIDNFSFSANTVTSEIPAPAALPAGLAMLGLLGLRLRRF